MKSKRERIYWKLAALALAPAVAVLVAHLHPNLSWSALAGLATFGIISQAIQPETENSLGEPSPGETNDN